MSYEVVKSTKIIATIGPSSFDQHVLKSLVKEGANIMRLNLSHGSLEEHTMIIGRIRAVSQELGKEVGILMDLPGPKVRLGRLPESLFLTHHHKVALISEAKAKPVAGAVNLPAPDVVLKSCKVGDLLAIDDGKVLLRVEEVGGSTVLTSVVTGGEVSSRKGIAILGADLPLPALTDIDMQALTLASLVDFIAVSFVKTAADVYEVRRIARENIKDGKPLPKIIAKIETVSAIENLGEVIKAADGLMVARGDLALAVNPAELGILQKRIISATKQAGKPVIVATQMLDSMIHHPLPTRAEILDVTNAVIDGADGVMLSGETASGDFPKKAVSLMSEIASLTERAMKEGSAGVAQNALGYADFRTSTSSL